MLVGDVAGRSWWYRAQRPAQNPGWGWAKKKREKKAQLDSWRITHEADEESRGNSTDAGRGSTVGCLQFVFPTHTTPTEQRERERDRERDRERERERERERGMGCAAGMNRMGEQIATKVAPTFPNAFKSWRNRSMQTVLDTARRKQTNEVSLF